MKISDIITETTAGAVATVAMPMGKMHKRNPSVFPTTKKTKKTKKTEGKSPHKKGTKKYKKHMAAMHAGAGK
tara:strand:- start:38 stop:253 length:216 start_codon:yes stop_codon:yes gene_type:complete